MLENIKILKGEVNVERLALVTMSDFPERTPDMDTSLSTAV